jgi:hypothetical protein
MKKAQKSRRLQKSLTARPARLSNFDSLIEVFYFSTA